MGDVAIDRLNKIIESGLLSDLLEVKDVSQINRREFRRFIGLEGKLPRSRISKSLNIYQSRLDDIKEQLRNKLGETKDLNCGSTFCKKVTTHTFIKNSAGEFGWQCTGCCIGFTEVYSD